MDDSTGVVAASHGEIPRGSSTSWVPDAPTAFALRQLKGMCAQVSLADATNLLGSGARLEYEDISTCHYRDGNARRDLWLSAYSHGSDSTAIASLPKAEGSTPIAALGDAASLALDASGPCSTIGGARSWWTFLVSACGDGFGIPRDSIGLKAVARKVLGEPR